MTAALAFTVVLTFDDLFFHEIGPFLPFYRAGMSLYFCLLQEAVLWLLFRSLDGAVAISLVVAQCLTDSLFFVHEFTRPRPHSLTAFLIWQYFPRRFV